MPTDPFLLPDGVAADLCSGICDDPFRWLGLHRIDDHQILFRALIPGADALELVTDDDVIPLRRWQQDQPLYGVVLGMLPQAYRLRGVFNGHSSTFHDAYRFPSTLPLDSLKRFSSGTELHLHHWMGAKPLTLGGIAGYRFSVWAPNARRVSVTGDFNGWDGRRHVMRRHHDAGVWELFIPQVAAGDHYKFEILTMAGHLLQKADPLALQHQSAPATASLVCVPPEAVPATEFIRQTRAAPMSIYEVHAGSWRRNPDGSALNWDQLAEQLIPWVRELGFTHIEFLPLNEHPFSGSWGYQPTGLFAPTSRFGDWRAFRRLVESCHQQGIGVILDWVPGHFPKDDHALRRFDGTALYEHEDPRLGEHPDWGTLVYNFDRHEVRSFLLSSAVAWIERFGIDGLRVDAVASMLYRDYSRKAGEWLPNHHGGRENLGAIEFLRALNTAVYGLYPHAVTIAEESTAWPAVSRPVYEGGLGFGFKWNMGWMNDTLRYLAREPVHKSHHHHEITFGLIYAFAENFILPLSHDEVVHGKRSLLGKMPGDRWQQFANLRALYGLMWAHPGKKLMFMGGEFAQLSEWNHDASLDWHLTAHAPHRGVQLLVKDLNRLYTQEPALHRLDCESGGFEWLKVDDAAHSVFAFLRCAESSAPILVVVNFTPVVREGYRLGVPQAGRWDEILNTDSGLYDGSNVGNNGSITSIATVHDGRPCSIELTLPPLAAVWFRFCGAH
jgi:1,4-alpha-glucan branching enzyme